jgi:hypothetical protein
MAGSFNHVVSDDVYVGTDLLENMGDMEEAVEEMAFMLLWLSQSEDGARAVSTARAAYYERMRGEQPWPIWFNP